MTEDMPIYEFLIYGAKLRLIYYRNFSDQLDTVYDYNELNTNSRIMNTIGTAIQVSRVSQAFTPTKDMVFKSFKTNQYKFNMFETGNDLRFILFTNWKQQTIDYTPVFQSLFKCYIDSVKRNYLYEQDSVIDVPKFKEGTNAIFKELINSKRK